MLKKANTFFYYLVVFRLSEQDKVINSINNNSNFLYWNLHYHNLYNCLLMFHIHVYQMKKWVELGMCM